MRDESIQRSGRQPGEPQVALPPDLFADLCDWTIDLRAGSFTAMAADMLLHDLRRAVPSALGYALILVGGPERPEVSVTVAERRLTRGQILSTITFDVPLNDCAAAEATFYAGQAGAFDTLALALRNSTAFGTRVTRLGGPLDADVEPCVRGLADHTKVNRAIGVLLGRGKSHADADRHLQRLADRHGSLEAAAEHVLMS